MGYDKISHNKINNIYIKILNKQEVKKVKNNIFNGTEEYLQNFIRFEDRLANLRMVQFISFKSALPKSNSNQAPTWILTLNFRGFDKNSTPIESLLKPPFYKSL